MRIALVSALAGVVLAAAGAASAATAPKATKWIDSKDGFSIILPSAWYPVPRTVAGVQAMITKYKKTPGVPTAYRYYLTAAGKQELKDYVFQAFVNVYPSTDPVIPVISIQISTSKPPYKASELTEAADTFGSVLASNKGAKVSAPQTLKFSEGTTELLTATIPVAKGLSEGTELYLIIHGGKLYVLKFVIDATALKSFESTFKAIAENFRFV